LTSERLPSRKENQAPKNKNSRDEMATEKHRGESKTLIQRNVELLEQRGKRDRPADHREQVGRNEENSASAVLTYAANNSRKSKSKVFGKKSEAKEI